MSFLKVKRKYEEDPKEVFILASKKHKSSDIEDHDPIFKLAISAVKEKDINDVIVETIKNRDVKIPQCNLEKLRNRMREDNKNQTKNYRYHLYAAMRKLDDANSEQAVPFIDVIDDDTIEKENPDECVYDLYYSSMNVDVTDPDFPNNHILHDDISEEYVWYSKDESENEEIHPDEDDSNDEDNWRNEYPEEESSDEESDDSLTEKMGKTRISSDYSSPSEDSDDHFDGFDYYDDVASSSDSDDESWA